VSLFIYQSFDAIDGKQARRTNTSSPLGELFDQLRFFFSVCSLDDG
jgi:phosphatidylglycerophosphate synthase